MSPGFLLRNGSDRMERVRKGYIPVKNNKGGGEGLGKLELMRSFGWGRARGLEMSIKGKGEYVFLKQGLTDPQYDRSAENEVLFR